MPRGPTVTEGVRTVVSGVVGAGTGVPTADVSCLEVFFLLEFFLSDFDFAEVVAVGAVVEVGGVAVVGFVGVVGVAGGVDGGVAGGVVGVDGGVVGVVPVPDGGVEPGGGLGFVGGSDCPKAAKDVPRHRVMIKDVICVFMRWC